jgi:hypothetical protein
MMKMKRNLLILLVLIILICPRFPFVQATTNYGFEADGVGNVPAGWLDGSSAACSARVSDDVAHGGTKSVKFVDANNNGWSILNIQNQFDEVEMTFWQYMFDTDRGLLCYGYEDGVGSDILGIFGFADDNKMYAWDGAVKTEIVAAYNKEQWYKIRMVYDLANDNYDVYVDDVLEADDFDFFNGAATSFKSCRFTTAKVPDDGTMGYIDDVTIGEVTYTPPDDPNLLFGAGFNGSTPYVELHWNHTLVDVYYFEVQNSSDGTTWAYLGNTTTANYTDYQVLNGTERYYRVRADNFTAGSWWNSSFSNINFETVYFIPSGGAVGGLGSGAIGFIMLSLICTPLILLLWGRRR